MQFRDARRKFDINERREENLMSMRGGKKISIELIERRNPQRDLNDS